MALSILIKLLLQVSLTFLIAYKKAKSLKNKTLFPAGATAGAAQYMTPYQYATLPQTTGFPGLSAYQGAGEARLQ